MPDRSSRSQRGGGFISISGLTPPELPDYQSDLNKQLSFLKSMDAYMNPGGSGGGTIRNANGLTPYQQAQLDYKLAKDAAKAAEVEAKKNVIVGTNPKTGQPMVYRNETGYKLSDKRMQEIYAGMLEDELRKDIANDEELNRIKGIAFGPRPISIDYRKQLERQYRDRTKALASIYKIDDRAAFDAAFGEQSKSIRNEQQRALNEDSFLSVLGSGVAQGWSDFLNAMRMPFQSETERLETARQSLKERQERIAASPTLREREMEEQEAAEQGKDISYWQATDKNRASNLAASVAGTLTSFAVPVGLSMAAAPFTGGASLTGLSSLATAVPIAATGVLGAGMNQLGQAQRAAQDPNLTEEQKTDVLSMSDPGFAGTTLLGGVAGALMPGGVGSGALKLANKAVGDAAATGIRGTIGRAAVRSAERAAAPRTMGTLARDIAVNSGENAAIMGANTIGANIAYNASTDQPLMQGATQGALGAIGEGAIIGVPFGGARTLRRPRVAKAEAPAAGESAAETPSNTGEMPAPQTPAAQPQNTTWTQRLRTDSGFNAWSNDLVQATRTNNAAKVDELVAEYLAGGGRLEDLELIRDSYAKDSKKRLVSDAEFAKAHDGLGHVRASDEFGWNEKNDEGINAAIARWKEAENNDALDKKITGAFTGEQGQNRVAGIMAELKPARAGSTAGQGNNADSAMEGDTGANAENVADGTPVQNSANPSGVESEQPGRKPTQNLRQTEGYPENAGQEAAKQQEGVVPANAGSAGAGSGKAGDGAGSELNPTVGRDGSQSDAAANSGGEQSVGELVVTYRPDGTHTFDYAPQHDVLEVEGKAGKSVFFRKKGETLWRVYNPDTKKFYSVASRDAWDNIPEDIRKIGKNYSEKNGGVSNKVMSKALTELADNEAAKSTNPKGGVNEAGDTVREARGWHGSGADFDAFDLSYAHSGEGGSAHGWGVYTALEEKSPFDKTKRKSQYSGRSTAESYRDQATWRKAKRLRNTVFESSGHRWVEGFNKDTGQQTWFSENGKPVSEAEHAAFVTVIYEGSVEEAQNSLVTEILDKEVRIERLNKEIDALETTAVAYNGLGSEDLKALKENYDSEIHLMNMYEGALKFLDQHEDLSIIAPAKSRLYNVEVPDADKLLHLDNTFAEQPPFVQDALRRLYNDNNKETAFSLVTRKVLERYINGDAKTKGRRVYETLDRELGSNSAASHMLNYYGIEGNYAFGHRDGPVAVVFNDKAVDILSKERRENLPSYLFSYEQAVGELSPLFKTQKEKDILATIAQLGGRSPDYIATLPDGSFATKSQLMEQAMQIVMSRMPGFKKGKMRADSGDGRALGRYHADTGDIFIDTAYATDVVRFLDTLQHEIGHKSLEELANPSLRTYTSEVMYNNFDPETAARVAETYETSRTDFVGEELYAQYESGATPFADTDSMRGALVSMFTNSNDEAVTRTVSRALSFFARNADSGTFNEFLKASIMSDKNVQDALIKNNLDSIDNALARQFAEDYRNVAHEADVPLNIETLGYYLDAVLDHDTSLNVWKRQSMPC